MTGNYVFRFYNRDNDGNLVSPFVSAKNEMHTTHSQVSKAKVGEEQESNKKYKLDNWPPDDAPDEVYVKQDPHEPIKSFIPKYRKGLSVIGRPTSASEFVDFSSFLTDPQFFNMATEPHTAKVISAYLREFIAKIKLRPNTAYGKNEKFTQYIDLAEKDLDDNNFERALSNISRANSNITRAYSDAWHKEFDDIVKDLGMDEATDQYSSDMDALWNDFKQSMTPTYYMSNNALTKALNRMSDANADAEYEHVLRAIKDTYDSLPLDTELYLAGADLDDLITTNKVINDSLTTQRDFPQELVFTKILPKRKLDLDKFSDTMSSFDKKKKAGASARDIFYDTFKEDPDLLISDTTAKQIIRDLSQDSQQASFNDIIDVFNCMRGC